MIVVCVIGCLDGIIYLHINTLYVSHNYNVIILAPSGAHMCCFFFFLFSIQLYVLVVILIKLSLNVLAGCHVLGFSIWNGSS